MGVQTRRIKGVFKSVFARARTRVSEFIKPLNPRERFVYGSIAIVFVIVLIGPRVIATTSDEGSIISVASTLCSSDEGWLSPENVTGQHSVQGYEGRTEITDENSARWLGTNSELTCSGFSPQDTHNRINNAVSISLKASRDENTTSQVDAAASESATLLDGQILSERINQRQALIEPNLLDQTTVPPSLDGLLQLSISSDGGETWALLHRFDQSITLANVSTFDVAIPDSYVKNPKRLAFKLETVTESESLTILIDGITWTYEVARSNELSVKLLNRQTKQDRTEEAPVINEMQDLFFEVKLKNPNDGIWQGIRSQASDVVGDVSGPDISITATLLKKNGEQIESQPVIPDFKDIDMKNQATWEVTLDEFMPQSLDPGVYTVLLEVDDGSNTVQSITQDFIWGVLALNTDKSSYQPNDTATLQMAVLDEIGATVCDAILTVSITGPSGPRTLSTEDNTITINDSCTVYGNQITPDYEASYAFRDAGKYTFRLEAQTRNGNYAIEEVIQVIDNPAFEISRSGPTRVFPIVDYPMQITVYSRDGFSGTITEEVPGSFEIRSDGNSIDYSEKIITGETQTLSWNVEIEAGQSVTVGYQFDAPDISPEFYVTGPATLSSADAVLFIEQRAWQLAGDAPGRMILFYEGDTSGLTNWTCISCTSGDDFFQRFVKGAAAYGTVAGGSATHTHTATTTITPSTASATEASASTNISGVGHTHTTSTTLNPATNIPAYKELSLIRHNTTGVPASIPAGAIAIFESASAVTGWSDYTAANGRFVRGADTSAGTGATAGSNSHTVTISGTANAASTATDQRSRGGGTQTTGAVSGHTHSYSGTSASASHLPPNITVVLKSANTTTSTIPIGLVAMWDGDPPSAGWDTRSGVGDPYNGQFIQPSTSYGSTSGSSTHSHTDTVLTTLGPSATTNGRTGTAGASATHTHTVTISGYSNENHEPPYWEAVFAKYNPVTKYEQASFRFFENDDSTDVGSPIGAQNTAVSSPAQGTPFRLRMNLHISEVDLAQNGENFKLQYAQQSGSCDIGFTGESYIDVGTVSGAIRYFNNTTPSDNTALSTNVNDPTHGTDTINAQSYEESNNFTNSQSAIPAGEDGLWDFSLVDISASSETAYCFRVVKSDGSELDTYTVIPQITTPPPPPRMMALWDGTEASIPSGWSCISCTGGDANQRMLRGAATYGGTGGADTHTHSATGAVLPTGTPALGETQPGATVSNPDHSHTYTPIISPESNLPAYRDVLVIQYDAGTPSTIPSGAIVIFPTASLPANFTEYIAQGTNYVRGNSVVGTATGSNTHSHTISGSTSAATTITTDAPRTNGNTQPLANVAHDHTISATTGTVNHEPPYREVTLYQANTDVSIPGGMIAMWTDNPGGTWTCVSCTSGDILFQRFFKPSSGGTASSDVINHSHADVTGISSGPANQTVSGRTGASGDNAAHTHTINVTGFSTDAHLPPYLNVIFYQSPTNNANPLSPTSLDQQKTNTTSIATGDWTNETSVLFEAQVSDADNPDTVQLCVEVQEVGTAFTNSETLCGTGVSYAGSAVAATVTISGLLDGSSYHWQARTKDALGAYSAWVSYGGNAESATDFRIDASAPTGTVYDGTTIGVDIDYNDGSLNNLDANWNIDASASGLSGYEYSIGTVAGATDIVGWTSNGTTASVTDAPAVLTTSQVYYFNVRTTDNAGNQSIISSDGILVTPTLSFSTSPGSVSFGSLNPGNNYTATQVATLTTSTNAYSGYTIRAYSTGLLTSGSDTIPLFDGGTYASPDGWQSGDTGYGYTSSDTTIQGVNIFNSATCAGGNTAPCYAPISLSAPGDIVADHTDTISGTSVINEQFNITHRVTTSASQAPGSYTTVVIYNITARY